MFYKFEICDFIWQPRIIILGHLWLIEIVMFPGVIYDLYDPLAVYRSRSYRKCPPHACTQASVTHTHMPARAILNNHSHSLSTTATLPMPSPSQSLATAYCCLLSISLFVSHKSLSPCLPLFCYLAFQPHTQGTYTTIEARRLARPSLVLYVSIEEGSRAIFQCFAQITKTN